MPSSRKLSLDTSSDEESCSSDRECNGGRMTPARALAVSARKDGEKKIKQLMWALNGPSTGTGDNEEGYDGNSPKSPPRGHGIDFEVSSDSRQPHASSSATNGRSSRLLRSRSDYYPDSAELSSMTDITLESSPRQVTGSVTSSKMNKTGLESAIAAAVEEAMSPLRHELKAIANSLGKVAARADEVEEVESARHTLLRNEVMRLKVQIESLSCNVRNLEELRRRGEREGSAGTPSQSLLLPTRNDKLVEQQLETQPSQSPSNVTTTPTSSYPGTTALASPRTEAKRIRWFKYWRSKKCKSSPSITT